MPELVIKTKTGYQCPYCSRDYKEKFNLTNHVGICRFLQLSRREQNNEVELVSEELPTQHELFRIIQHLSLRIDKLEKDNTKLKQQNSKKINIMEWLNSSETQQPNVCFKDWTVNVILPKVISYMEIAYNKSLFDSMSSLFDEVFNEKKRDDLFPICSFNDKSLVFYVYKEVDGKNQWLQMTNPEFDGFIKQITARYYTEFIKGWYAEYESLILENETYYETYMRYYKKISGDDNYIKFKKRLYMTSKQELPS